MNDWYLVMCFWINITAFIKANAPNSGEWILGANFLLVNITKCFYLLFVLLAQHIEKLPAVSSCSNFSLQIILWLVPALQIVKECQFGKTLLSKASNLTWARSKRWIWLLIDVWWYRYLRQSNSGYIQDKRDDIAQESC